MGDFPEFEFSVQAFDEKTAAKFPFDILDATKLIPEEMVPLAADRPDGARSQSRQLLRRDRTGGLPSRPHRARHRLHERSPAAGPAVLLYRHAVAAPGRRELPRDPDQPAEVPDAQLPARRRAPDGRQPGPGRLRAEQPGARLAARRSRRWFRVAHGTRPRRQGPRAVGDVRRSLQPAAAVLALDVRARTAAHRQRLHLRIEQGVDRGHSPPHARPPGDHRRRPAAARGRRASAWKDRPSRSRRRGRRST